MLEYFKSSQEKVAVMVLKSSKHQINCIAVKKNFACRIEEKEVRHDDSHL